MQGRPTYACFGALTLGIALWASSANADQIGPYSGRSLTLGQGTFRIDAGPPDYGYFHPGNPQLLNENRGVRVLSTEGGETSWLAAGLAYGATDDIEVGGLLVPLVLGPDTRVDDLEFYGRFRFLREQFEMGAQVTMQIPANTAFGLGVGLPMLAHASQRMRIDTGVELEILFWEDDAGVSLDGPLAFTWDVGRLGFLGFRTGLYVGDMDWLAIPAGIHGGVVVAEGHLDIAGWFMWPALLGTGRDDPFDLRTFQVGFGLNGRI
jgi:hypothetical protein